MTRKILSLFIIVLVGVGVLSYFLFMKGIEYADPELEFPILEPELVERIAAYQTPDWGEPGVFHNGIDLLSSQTM